MPQYQFQLRSRDCSEPVFEPVSACDDDEARSLAEIRLLMTRGVSAVTVSRSGLEILRVHRDASGAREGLAGPLEPGSDVCGAMRRPSR